ncbi:MAG: hypothetical protein Q7K65_04505 [Candidatus Buchananbacteria bacterium]|nr:hypothetical protein [Candidatus Buchananbacteria bacterium]
MMSKTGKEPKALSKARFRQELQTLLKKIKDGKCRDYSPMREEFSFFVLAQKFWPEMTSSIFVEYEFFCSGVGSIFREITPINKVPPV